MGGWHRELVVRTQWEGERATTRFDRTLSDRYKCTPRNRYKRTLRRVMRKATVDGTVALNLAPRNVIMSKSIALGLLCAGALLLAALLTGCSDEPSPTPSAGAVPTPAVIAQPGVTPVPPPTSTMVATDTLTPEPTPATATLPLGVYLTLCAQTEQDLADDATFGDFSSELGAELDRLEALTPPAQLSEWHLLNIEAYRTTQALVDIQPKDDVADFNSSFLIAVADDFGEKLSEAAARVPKDVRQQMIEAGCLDPDIVPDDYDEPDDHGNNFESATRIAVGEAVAIALEDLDDKDVLVFLVEPGTEYVFTLGWESYNGWSSTAGPILALFDAGGQELARLFHSDVISQYTMMWQAVARGDYYIVVGNGVTRGFFALTVTEGGAAEPLDRDDHGNSEGDATAIRVGTDVRGALDYDDDIDFFRFQAERGQSYQIDVALGTLDDSIVDLYDVDWSFLDSNDDYGDTFASRLYWEAPSSGERYVLVGGYGIGTYTLTVSIVDDRGDTAEDGGSVAPDRAALVALYNATEGGSWTTRTNWLSGRPLDEWHGVTTDSDGRVTELNLSFNSVKGALPAELGDLTNLESLRLSENPLTGPIPAELGDLTNLRELHLGSQGYSRLTGPIPAALGDLTNLESLVLNNNELTGPIPAELGDLSNLEFLDLGGANQLTGRIPAELGDLSNLKELDLWGNELTGPIPAELGDLTNLRALNLGSNQLTGRIPAELGSLSNLTELLLYGNELSGCVPSSLEDQLTSSDLGGLPFC